VGGATARDILTTHRFGIEQSRATADVDIGVCIESWQGDRQLRDALIGTGRFEPSGEAQRLCYTAPDSGERMWLDIVPFGGLEREGDREIEWPGGAFRMNVAGFGEALEAAVEVELADACSYAARNHIAHDTERYASYADSFSLSKSRRAAVTAA
jgi:predicted nucleotidyltransferase